MKPWTNSSTCLCLYFPICKMGTLSTIQSLQRLRVHTYKTMFACCSHDRFISRPWSHDRGTQYIYTVGVEGWPVRNIQPGDRPGELCRPLWIKCLEREFTHSWYTSQVRKQRPHVGPGKWNYLIDGKHRPY